MLATSLIDTNNGIKIERMPEYEVPLEETFAEQFKDTDMLVFCSTFNDIGSRRTVCTAVLIGKNCIYRVQKFLKQRDYQDVELSELLSILHIMATLRSKNTDQCFRETFQVEEGKSLRVQVNISNLIVKDSIKLAFQYEFQNKNHDITFLLGSLRPQLYTASHAGVDVTLNNKFKYHDYVEYCNRQCQNAMLENEIQDFIQIYPIEGLPINQESFIQQII